MIFRPYYYDDLGCAAYVLGCGTLGKGAVVDARADDIESHIEFASAKGLRLTHIIDTHVHADHRSGGPELARRVGAQYCIHEAADVTYAFAALHEGDQIELGNTHVLKRDWRRKCGSPPKGNPFRAFVHPVDRMTQTIERVGFHLAGRRQTWQWSADVGVR